MSKKSYIYEQVEQSNKFRKMVCAKEQQVLAVFDSLVRHKRDNVIIANMADILRSRERKNWPSADEYLAWFKMNGRGVLAKRKPLAKGRESTLESERIASLILARIKQITMDEEGLLTLLATCVGIEPRTLNDDDDARANQLIGSIRACNDGEDDAHIIQFAWQTALDTAEEENVRLKKTREAIKRRLTPSIHE